MCADTETMPIEGGDAKVRVGERFLVVPGDLIAEGDYKIHATSTSTIYRMGRKFYSAVVGLAQIDERSKTIKVIPLEGYYYPSEGDVVVGVVRSVGLTSWEIDIRAPFPGVLYASEFLGRPINPAKEELTDFLNVGDVVVAKVEVFDRTRDPLLSTKGKGLGRVTHGAIVEISPVKVPRVIGRKGSMQATLEGETGCKLTVGKNGRIVIDCPNEELKDILVLAIRKIEREAHIPGLTDRIKEFIMKEKVRRGLVYGRS